ncbi:MAG: Asp-tRNA(Asn)/Glu-tRNA(Gln) amidotransferase subunit GatB [Oscillospiraceae bacterium]|nr:Asp-tRNA(Asn)/Glu-tRNA(Gln) amidotransferase subunit GatB [Oscillospiraceae bacterium]
MLKDYEMVIGLEVHVELKTRTKIFCSCPTTFGAAPNTQCCPVCMGMPGTLPVLNRQVVDYAVKAGLATNCTIASYSKQDRKNYFYPDLPKAYQISQYDLPLCQHGWLDIETEAGSKRIGITRIHIEEDAGKLVHDAEKGTMVDCNRCGVPLIEIVSEPDIRSAEEAIAYLQKLRAAILYTGISDCRMQEGSLRCDVNLSVRRRGEEAFGTRTEMKNLNSFQFIQKAIEYEFRRQVEEIENGGEIEQETRRFDEKTGKTFSMRKKEDANDYRYFPDPDLAPIEVSAPHLEELRASIPELPDERKQKYMERYGLTAYDGEMLTGSVEMADYFEAVAAATPYPKQAANLILSEVFRLLPPDCQTPPVAPAHLAALVTLTGDGKINSSTCKKVLAVLWEQDQDPETYVEQHGLLQQSDPEVLRPVVEEVLKANPKSVSDYRSGKTAAAKALMGQIMARTGGKANPLVVQQLLEQALTVES